MIIDESLTCRTGEGCKTTNRYFRITSENVAPGEDSKFSIGTVQAVPNYADANFFTKAHLTGNLKIYRILFKLLILSSYFQHGAFCVQM